MNFSDISFKHLIKQFNHQPLFSIDELHLKKGECCLLSGDNGSGKTTLLKIIAGLEKPQAAEIILHNKSYTWQQYQSLCHKNVIYLHQHAVMFNASVKDNIAYGLKKAGLQRYLINEMVAEALAWAQLENFAHRNARTLSGGEKQRVALARAHVLSPSFLLLDEATTNMDHKALQRTLDLVCQMKNEGIGILFTSHDQHTFSGLVDRHLCLQDGELSEYDKDAVKISNVTSISSRQR